jgi:hypothetical protein
LNSVGGFDFSLKDGIAYPVGTDLVVTARNAVAGDFYYTLTGADPRYDYSFSFMTFVLTL